MNVKLTLILLIAGMISSTASAETTICCFYKSYDNDSSLNKWEVGELPVKSCNQWNGSAFEDRGGPTDKKTGTFTTMHTYKSPSVCSSIIKKCGLASGYVNNKMETTCYTNP